MSERPTTCEHDHTIEWLFVDPSGCALGICDVGVIWYCDADGNLDFADSDDSQHLIQPLWSALSGARQARTAAETQATYWQREQATADAKWKELQTALRAERQARQAAEARAAKLEEMLRHIATISAKPHLRKKAAVIEYCVNQAIDTDPSPLLALVEAARQLDVAQTFDALMIAAHSVKAALAKLDGVAS